MYKYATLNRHMYMIYIMFILYSFNFEYNKSEGVFFKIKGKKIIMTLRKWIIFMLINMYVTLLQIY